MTDWSIVFLLVALISGAFGFAGFGGAAGGPAQILCVIFACFSLGAALVHLRARPVPRAGGQAARPAASRSRRRTSPG